MGVQSSAQNDVMFLLEVADRAPRKVAAAALATLARMLTLQTEVRHSTLCPSPSSCLDCISKHGPSS